MMNVLQGDYMHHVELMLKQQRTRLLLSLDELRNFDVELTRSCAQSRAPSPTRHARLNNHMTVAAS